MYVGDVAQAQGGGVMYVPSVVLSEQEYIEADEADRRGDTV
jgi:hypothetical protein